MKYFLVLLFPVLIAASCSKEEDTSSRFRLNETTVIQKGDKARLFDIDFRVELDDVEDSRCPEGAVCVWEGEAIAKLHVKTLKTDTIVALSDHPDRKDSARIDKYFIHLESVNPYPKVDEEIKIEDYSVRFYVRKAS